MDEEYVDALKEELISQIQDVPFDCVTEAAEHLRNGDRTSKHLFAAFKDVSAFTEERLDKVEKIIGRNLNHGESVCFLASLFSLSTLTAESDVDDILPGSDYSKILAKTGFFAMVAAYIAIDFRRKVGVKIPD